MVMCFKNQSYYILILLNQRYQYKKHSKHLYNSILFILTQVEFFDVLEFRVQALLVWLCLKNEFLPLAVCLELERKTCINCTRTHCRNSHEKSHGLRKPWPIMIPEAVKEFSTIPNLALMASFACLRANKPFFALTYDLLSGLYRNLCPKVLVAKMWRLKLCDYLH